MYKIFDRENMIQIVTVNRILQTHLPSMKLWGRYRYYLELQDQTESPQASTTSQAHDPEAVYKVAWDGDQRQDDLPCSTDGLSEYWRAVGRQMLPEYGLASISDLEKGVDKAGFTSSLMTERMEQGLAEGLWSSSTSPPRSQLLRYSGQSSSWGLR